MTSSKANHGGTHRLIRAALTFIFLQSAFSAQAQSSPATRVSEYLGDIRRDASGQLIVVPFVKADPATSTSNSAPNLPSQAPARTLRVGPSQSLQSISNAAAIARDGDTIEIEAGDYVADVAVWKQKNLTLRGVGGQPRLIANGASAEGKAIWVMRGGDITIENIIFSGSRVTSKNGAGIRFEKGNLHIRNCRFTNNENGILTSGGEMTLHIEDSEFDHNGYGDGYSHNLYVGDIRKLRIEGSYFHHANVGHLIKSRARENDIRYNRITDEAGGRASYEIDLPNGGHAYIIGNIIEKSATPENNSLISFGVEGLKHPDSRLYLAQNTIINRRPNGGNLFALADGPAHVFSFNNVLVGKFNEPGDMEHTRVETQNTILATSADFVSLERYDFRPILGRKITKSKSASNIIDGIDLAPSREYDHPTSTRPINSAKYPGAIQAHFAQ